MLWGGSFYFAKIAVPEIPPLTLALGRVGIAAIALLIVARLVAGPFPRDPAVWLQLGVLAALNNAIPFTLIFWGQFHISIGLASILNATTPLFGVLVAHVLTQDDRLTSGPRRRPARRLRRRRGADRAGAARASSAPTCWRSSPASRPSCSYAFGAVLSRRLRGLSPMMVASGQLTMSTVLLLPVGSAVRPAGGVLHRVERGARRHCSASRCCRRPLAYLIYFRLIARAGATNALLVTFLIPVSAILMGLVLLDESIGARQLAGMAAIFIGVAAIDGRAGRFIARNLQRTNS